MANKLEKCKENKIETDLNITSGNPAEEILQVAEENDVDLIVMAKKRKLKSI
ncbi:MAG TPA: universal stress protein [Nitrosopumilaceae archaeon]|nr:universal stress protein [Nitrosopumilaceae archaeon]